jgi:hypothetical protein
MGESSKAVFLSYASQDAGAAARICQVLSEAGLEVWFDQSELRGGEAWDASIRAKIRSCRLFVPIISANTESRGEGYFRLEWKLAVDRLQTMAEDEPFLLPIVIDGTPEATARVPDSFRTRQWIRLADGSPASPLVHQARSLLGRGHVSGSPNAPPSHPIEVSAAPLTRTAANSSERLKLIRVERVPSAKGASSIVSIIVFAVVIGLAVGGSIGFLAWHSSATPYEIRLWEVRNIPGIVGKLKSVDADKQQAELWKLFSVQGKDELSRLASMPGGEENEYQMKVALLRELNNIIRGRLALIGSTEGTNTAQINRRAIESRFPDDISRLLGPRTFSLDTLIQEARAKKLPGLVIILLVITGLIVIATSVFLRPTANRFVLEDTRGMDELLSHLVGEMGFRSPMRNGSSLIFKPTVATLLLWGPVKFSARIDGNSVVITAPALMTRKFTAALSAFVDGPTAVKS